MHPVIGPSVEAERLYVAQSRLRARLAAPGPRLVLFDVGLGAGSNALAALAAARDGARRRPGDRDRLVRGRPAGPRPRRVRRGRGPARPRPRRARRGARAPRPRTSRDPAGRSGDSSSAISARPCRASRRSPTSSFWDPFSPKANPELWTHRAFSALRARCGEATTVYTYSTATATRSALLLAGFFVGAGDPSGPKEETTAAATDPSLLARPLDLRWLARLERSSAPFPPDAPPDALDRVRAHPQFR